MAAGGKRRVIESITVQEFLERHGDDLELSTEHPVTGLDRVIEEPAVNRPGTRLSGLYRLLCQKADSGSGKFREFLS